MHLDSVQDGGTISVPGRLRLNRLPVLVPLACMPLPVEQCLGGMDTGRRLRYYCSQFTQQGMTFQLLFVSGADGCCCSLHDAVSAAASLPLAATRFGPVTLRRRSGQDHALMDEVVTHGAVTAALAACPTSAERDSSCKPACCCTASYCNAHFMALLFQ